MRLASTSDSTSNLPILNENRRCNQRLKVDQKVKNTRNHIRNKESILPYTTAITALPFRILRALAHGS